MIPTDGSRDAEKATDHAFTLAGYSNAEILGISVVDTSYRKLLEDNVNARLEEILRNQAENAVKTLMDKFKSMQREGHMVAAAWRPVYLRVTLQRSSSKSWRTRRLILS